MKVAAIIHGNLRTFLMPLHENDNYKELLTLNQGYLDILPEGTRVCDVFFNSVVVPNNADVFAVTDTTNFYYKGEQRLNSGLHGENFNRDTQEDIDIIEVELKRLFGDYLKGVRIKTDDISKDKKLKLLTDANSGGADPSKLVNQYLKIKHGYDLMRRYEKKNNIKYDLLIKTRFDNLHGANQLNLNNYDWENYDVFVPGGEAEMFIYDWCAFGSRKAMELYNLYDVLGFTLDKRVYNNGADSTIASEHHIYRLFQENNIRHTTSGFYSCPLRFNHGYTI